MSDDGRREVGDARDRDDRLDAAIDRAVREMLDVEPPSGLRGRVLDRLDAISPSNRCSFRLYALARCGTLVDRRPRRGGRAPRPRRPGSVAARRTDRRDTGRAVDGQRGDPAHRAAPQSRRRPRRRRAPCRSRGRRRGASKTAWSSRRWRRRTTRPHRSIRSRRSSRSPWLQVNREISPRNRSRSAC